MIIYLDAVLALNFVIDLLLLVGASRICGWPIRFWRCFVAAVIGGIYATICMLPGFQFLGNMLWRAVSLAVIAIVAFGLNMNAVRTGAVFVLLSMAMGGVAVSFESEGKKSILYALCSLIGLCVVGFRYRPGSVSFLPVELKSGSKSIRITALCDTGNTLFDPITGNAVLIVDAAVAKELTGLLPEQLRDPVGVMSNAPISGLRLIPYRTVGMSDGMLLALRLPQVKIGKRIENTMVALSPEKLSVDGTYQALTGGMQ